MARIPLGSFSPAATQNLRGNVQLRADDQGNLTGVARNKFKQFFSALTRTDADRTANRTATQSYVNHVRNTLGFEASVIAQEALGNRLRDGNPLSMRKIRAIETQMTEAARSRAGKPIDEPRFLAKDFSALGDRIGGGANNQIAAAEYRDGNRTFVGALKKMAADSGSMMLPGIDSSYKPETGEHLLIERNLASARLAETLGLPVIAGGYRVEDEGGSPALLMELVDGRSAKAAEGDVNHTNDGPELRRGLVALQIVDLLTAQADRNLDNILLKRDLGRDTPVGIDNDLSFGTARNVADWHSQLNHAAKPVGLPAVIDQSMKEAIQSLDETKCRDIMGEKLASPERLAAAMSRLEELQAHVGSDNVTVIEDDQWDTEVVDIKLSEGRDNYWSQIVKQPIAIANRAVSQPTHDEIIDDIASTWNSSNNDGFAPQKLELDNGKVLTMPYQPAVDLITRGEIHYNGETLTLSAARSETNKSPAEFAKDSARALARFIEDKFGAALGTAEFDRIVHNLMQYTTQGAGAKAVIKGFEVCQNQPSGKWFPADHPSPFTFRLEVNGDGNISVRENAKAGLAASGTSGQFASILETTRTYDLNVSALRSEQFDPRAAISNARGQDVVQSA